MQISDFDFKWRATEWGEFPAHFSDTACKIVSEHYFQKGEESFFQVVKRVVDEIVAHSDAYFNLPGDRDRFAFELADGIFKQRYSFNSPVWYNVGVHANPQCSACFILPVEDNMESIMDLAKTEAMLFKGGSGTGTNLSPLRSGREHLSGSKGTASGPVSFMKMYDAVAGVVKSGGRTRRAAKMQVLNSDHPDIFEFIEAKQRAGEKAKALINSGVDPETAYDTVPFQNFNCSVRVTDDFMRSLGSDSAVTVQKPKDPLQRFGYHSNNAIFKAVCEAAHACGDPGLQFTGVIDENNMTPLAGSINASNPCSEFMFIDNSACNLASINLVKYIGEDYKLFANDVKNLITAMDIIVNISSYPTEEIRANSLKYRPLGLGLTNVGAYVMQCGHQYDSVEATDSIKLWATDLMREATRTSAELAKKFGAYPGWGEHAEAILERQCNGIIHGAAQFGIRNAQLTLMAPTGTISFMMDCESTGIEPVVAENVAKTLVNGSVVEQRSKCIDEWYLAGYTDVPQTAIGSNPVSIDGHLRMMAAMQPHLSGAISKTVNLPSDATVEDVALVYRKAWDLCLKSIAVFRDGCKGHQPLKVIEPSHATAFTKYPTINLDLNPIGTDWSPGSIMETDHLTSVPFLKKPNNNGRRRMSEERKSITHKFSLAGTEGYIHVGLYEDGTPGELFVHISKAGSTVGGLMDAWAVLFSLALQYGVPLGKLVRKYKGTRFEPSGFTNGAEIKSATSLVDYIAQWLEIRFCAPVEGGLVEEAAVHQDRGDVCPECGGLLYQTGSCKTCSNCGWNGGCG